MFNFWNFTFACAGHGRQVHAQAGTQTGRVMHKKSTSQNMSIWEYKRSSSVILSFIRNSKNIFLIMSNFDRLFKIGINLFFIYYKGELEYNNSI